MKSEWYNRLVALLLGLLTATGGMLWGYSARIAVLEERQAASEKQTIVVERIDRTVNVIDKNLAALTERVDSYMRRP